MTSVMVAAPTLTVVGRWATGTAVGQELPDLGALPGVLSGGPVPGPTLSDAYDLGDFLVQASAPTMPLLTLEITEEGRARFAVPRQEVGQGVRTMVAMFIAEELALPIDRVDVTLEDGRLDLLFNQLTGGSYNARALYQPVSRMAAAAREAMTAIVAEQLGVPASSLTVRDGMVVAPDGQSIPYGSLSQLTAALSRPGDPEPKPLAEHTLLGSRQVRTDAADIVTGAKRYTLDLAQEVLPDAVPTVVAHSPQIRSSLISFDNEEEIRGLPGVIDVALISYIPTFGYGEDPQFLGGAVTGIAIAAETTGHAIAAQERIQATWAPGAVAGYDDARFREELRAAALPQLPSELAPPGGENISLEFDFAHAAHAPMETMNALATVTDEGAEVWSGLKIPGPAIQEISEALGILPTQVTVHCVDAGGSFGRRLFHETALEAALASAAFGFPVKLMWTRDQDTRNDRLRPAAYVNIQATHLAGQYLSFQHRYSGGETSLSHGLGDALTSVGGHDPATQVVLGQSIFALQMSMPYNFGATAQLLIETDFNMLTGSWRSVYTGIGRTAEEIVVDEMARAIGEDPVEFRLRHAKGDRLREVIEWVRDNGDWGRAMAPGTAQGFAANNEHRGYQACLVEIDMNAARYDEDGNVLARRPRVTKAVMAFDAGIPFNVSGLEGQMLGGLNDGIATILQAGIHIDDGGIRERSFGDYYYTRADDYPRDVVMHVFPAREGAEPSGAGEGMVPTCAGAIANAIARATGTVPTSFPINH